MDKINQTKKNKSIREIEMTIELESLYRQKAYIQSDIAKEKRIIINSKTKIDSLISRRERLYNRITIMEKRFNRNGN